MVSLELEAFFVKYVLPELLTRSLEPGGETPVASTSANKQALPDNSDKYCYCWQGEHGSMIACDTPKWFHFSCVGLTNEPVGEWFCKECRSMMLQ